jgi:hypothetical protein
MKLYIFYNHFSDYYRGKNMATEARHSCTTPNQQNNAAIIRKFFDLGKRMQQEGKMTDGHYAEFCGAQYCDLLPARKRTMVYSMIYHTYIYITYL